MDPSKDYYLILEVHPKASPEMIERAKRLLLQRYHPDHNPDRPEWAAEQTRRVLEAYETLSDPLRRAEYDRARQQGVVSPSPPPRRAARAYAEAAPSTPTSPRAHPSRRVQPLRDDVRVVSCPHCGRLSRIPKHLSLDEVRCGACRRPFRPSFREQLRNTLDRASDALRRLLLRKPKEKSSR